MFISQQYSLGQIQQSVTFWYICVNFIENESLITSTNKKAQSRMQKSINLYTEFFILEIEIIAEIINKIFSLLLIISLQSYIRVLAFYASIPEIEHASC